MEFSQQEYWNGLPFLTPGDLPNLEMELTSLVSPALAGEFFTIEPLKNIDCQKTLYIIYFS